jgi:hypothetical protein
VSRYCCTCGVSGGQPSKVRSNRYNLSLGYIGCCDCDSKVVYLRSHVCFTADENAGGAAGPGCCHLEARRGRSSPARKKRMKDGPKCPFDGFCEARVLVVRLGTVVKILFMWVTFAD